MSSSDGFKANPKHIVSREPQSVWHIGNAKDVISQAKGFLAPLEADLLTQTFEETQRKFPSGPTPNLIFVESDYAPDAVKSVIEAAKASPRLRMVPLILLSQKEQEENLLAGIKAGADDFIHLPLRRHEFLVRVRNHLTVGSLHEQTQLARERSQMISNVMIGFNRGFAIHDAISPALLDVANHLGCDSAGVLLIQSEESRPDWIDPLDQSFPFCPFFSDSALETLRSRKEPFSIGVEEFGQPGAQSDAYLLFIPIRDGDTLLGYITAHNAAGIPTPSRKIVSTSIVCDSLAVTISRYNTLLAAEKTAAQLRRELQNLGRMQQMLLPKRLPDVPGLEIDAFYYPAEAAGGDYYDVIPLTDEHIGLIVADVSGHGAPAAMNMGIARSILHTVSFSQQTDPGKTVFFVNKLLCRLLGKGVYITLFYAVLNIRARELCYCNAGHVPAMIQSSKTGAIRVIGDPSNGPALGWFNDAEFEQETIKLEEGDLVTLYTDGVTEAINPAGEELTLERWIEHLERTKCQTCKETIETTKTMVEDHILNAELLDDVTLLSFMFHA